MNGAAGVLALAWTPDHAHRQAELDPSLPAGFAEQAALTLQVSRAHAEHELITLLEDRDRIGRDLHDLVIQRLFALGLSLQGVGRLTEDPEVRSRLASSIKDVDATIKDIRSTIFELGSARNPTDPREQVLEVVRRSEATLKCRPVLTMEGPVSTLIDPATAKQLLAVLTEALSNIARHADATRVSVAVTVGDEIVLEVADDGVGIPDGARESGLQNMRDRASRRGGSCEVGPAPGSGMGTRIRWAVPTTPPAPRR